MREPSKATEVYAWWRAQLGGAEQPITETGIHCGYFKCRAYSHYARAKDPTLVFPAPFLPGRIWLEQEIDYERNELTNDEKYLAEIGERRCNPMNAWMRLSQRPATYREWKWLTAMMPLLRLPRGTRTRTYT